MIHIGIFKKGDKRTIYNVIYLNGKGGSSYMKRFYITGLTREKEYDITKGLPGSKILWLTCNPNGEAETVRVLLKDEPDESGRRPRNRRLSINFSDLAVKGKESLGNLVTKYKIESKGITLEKKGASTLGGREVWFDRDVLRLNYDGRGESLGIFHGEDLVLIITKTGEYFTSSFADSNHYEDNILKIEKFDPHKIWTLVLNDASLGYPYIKRFAFEPSPKPQRFVGSDEQSSVILLTDTPYPRLKVEFGGADSVRPDLEIEADEFIGVKSFKAKGKRVSTYTIATVEELEPTKVPEEKEEVVEAAPYVEESDNSDSSDNSDNSDNPDSSLSPENSDDQEPTLFSFND